jgi:hypothetical protein
MSKLYENIESFGNLALYEPFGQSCTDTGVTQTCTAPLIATSGAHCSATACADADFLETGPCCEAIPASARPDPTVSTSDNNYYMVGNSGICMNGDGTSAENNWNESVTQDDCKNAAGKFGWDPIIEVKTGNQNKNLDESECQAYAGSKWGDQVNESGEIQGCYKVTSGDTKDKIYYNTNTNSTATCDLAGRVCIQKNTAETLHASTGHSGCFIDNMNGKLYYFDNSIKGANYKRRTTRGYGPNEIMIDGDLAGYGGRKYLCNKSAATNSGATKAKCSTANEITKKSCDNGKKWEDNNECSGDVSTCIAADCCGAKPNVKCNSAGSFICGDGKQPKTSPESIEGSSWEWTAQTYKDKCCEDKPNVQCPADFDCADSDKEVDTSKTCTGTKVASCDANTCCKAKPPVLCNTVLLTDTTLKCAANKQRKTGASCAGATCVTTDFTTGNCCEEKPVDTAAAAAAATAAATAAAAAAALATKQAAEKLVLQGSGILVGSSVKILATGLLGTVTLMDANQGLVQVQAPPVTGAKQSLYASQVQLVEGLFSMANLPYWIAIGVLFLFFIIALIM